MLRKFPVIIGCLLLLLAAGALTVNGQDGDDQFEEVLIRTSATDVVGLGDYIAGEAYAVAPGEDPAAQPMQALILPYAIYPSMGIATIDDFQQPDPAVEGFTFAWSLTPPEGSAAALLQEGAVAIFQTDIEGQYDLTLTATDADGNTAETTWTTFATTYVGVGGIAGEADFTQCSFCHIDQATAWMETGHATFFTRAIDGLASDHYGPNCISCHTTGFNNRPEADNGGFDDVAREAGWTFPEVLEEGNWVNMVEEFPEVAALANIQCESCHGPGNLHVNRTGTEDHTMIGLGLSFGTCAQCHGEEPYHVIAEQWQLSAHADKNAEAFWYPIGEDHLACVRCHSGAGFIDSVSGVDPEELRTDYQVITCAVCHDPHDAENPNQLRVFDMVVLPDGTDVTGAGPAATCMTCHNARTDPVASVEGENFSTPHYSTAAELMNGTGGYTWGETLPTGSHGFVVEGACIGCHMGETPGVDDMGTADDAADDQPLAGHNTVGSHTFSMVSPVDGTENVAICQACHGEVESFAFEAESDYDGDGAVETNQDEVAGLLEVVQGALGEQGVEVLESYPYFTLPENPSVDLKGAVYNFKFARSNGAAVHNLRYTVALLQLTYEKLAGEPVPGAEILPPE
jgi:hypothetical protein